MNLFKKKPKQEVTKSPIKEAELTEVPDLEEPLEPIDEEPKEYEEPDEEIDIPEPEIKPKATPKKPELTEEAVIGAFGKHNKILVNHEERLINIEQRLEAIEAFIYRHKSI